MGRSRAPHQHAAMGHLLEGGAGGISRLPGPLLKVNEKNAWEGLGREAALSRTLWAPVKKPPFWLSDQSLQKTREMSKCYKDRRGFSVA